MRPSDLKHRVQSVVEMYGYPVGTIGLLSDLGARTLAEVMRDDGLMLFDSRVSMGVRNAFLDALMVVDGASAGHSWVSPFAAGGFLSDLRWHDFAREVIKMRRYTYGTSLLEMLKKADLANPSFRFVVDSGKIFYRARRHRPEDGFQNMPIEQLHAPPAHSAVPGRANPAGIPVLYAASELATAIAEARPFVGGYISVAEGRPKNSLFMFDLTAEIFVAGMDPCTDEFRLQFDLAKLTAELDRAFARPVSPHATDRDYAPTQIVAETIRQANFSGIKYRSELNKGGFNYVFFDPRDLVLTFHGSFEVTSVKVEHQPNTMPFRLKQAMEEAAAENGVAGADDRPAR